ncbi:MAG: gfo/Idh/MocA family oxidoreductase [Chloroflexi bacterium]|nr:MAG: gfo/Idh/MocA family oxidoreductase [Chloroflexota bacterium]RLT33694.1 MAG: gfo/Idh/MocA family oxidoreductase [Chloroflexota bacterium]
MNTLGIGIVGYGAIARVHAAALALVPLMYPSLALRPAVVALTPGGPSSQSSALRDYPTVRQCSYTDLLADPTVGAVLISTPTGLHAEHVAQAIAAGKHIMCEKPLTVDPDQSRALVAAADAAGVVLVMNHHFRRIPALVDARQRIAAGHLGVPLRAHLRYYRGSNVSPERAVSWRFLGQTGGVLVDLGAHLIDLSVMLFGSPLVAVQATLRTVYPTRPDRNGTAVAIDVDDIATLHGRLANGMTVTFEASKMVPGAADGLRVEAYGTAGSLIYDMDDVNALRVGTAAVANSMQRVDVWNRTSPAATIPGSETATSSLSWHAASWEAFLATVAGESRIVCDGAGAVHVDAVIAAARRSATRDGAWEHVS